MSHFDGSKYRPSFAKDIARSLSSAAKTWIANCCAAQKEGFRKEVFAMAHIRSGGSKEIEENEFAVNPKGPSSSMQLTTVTPVANVPNADLSWDWSGFAMCCAFLGLSFLCVEMQHNCAKKRGLAEKNMRGIKPEVASFLDICMT